MVERRASFRTQAALDSGPAGDVPVGAAASDRRASSPARRPAKTPRLANERLILSLLRRHGPLSKIDAARQTGLSAQTAAALMNRLAADGLIARLDPTRGKVGQPAVPYALAPDGAFSLGLKIGRRSCDLILVDFTGAPRWRAHETFAYPMPAAILAFLGRALPQALASLSVGQRRRVAGLGVATPFELWNWGDQIGAPKGAMDAWRDFDILAEVNALSPYAVTLGNDATSACAAELFFGQGWKRRDFAYFFVGSFIGGGIALDGVLYPGRGGNAGAFGSMPVSDPEAGAMQTLIRRASIYTLENRLRSAGIDPSSIWKTPDAWDDFGAHLDGWIEEASGGLALATVAAISVIDFEAAVIDGAMPAPVRARLAARVAEKLDALDKRGLSQVGVFEGTIGPDARAIGGAALPFLAKFGHERAGLYRVTPPLNPA